MEQVAGGNQTAIGPWIYQTRASILRTVRALQERESIIVWPFIWYNVMFFRRTQAISRRQEYTADALGAKIAGTEAMASVLHKLDSGSAAFSVYFYNQIIPVVLADYLPPVSAGLDTFLRYSEAGQEISERVRVAEGELYTTLTIVVHACRRGSLSYAPSRFRRARAPHTSLVRSSC